MESSSRALDGRGDGQGENVKPVNNQFSVGMTVSDIAATPTTAKQVRNLMKSHAELHPVPPKTPETVASVKRLSLRPENAQSPVKEPIAAKKDLETSTTHCDVPNKLCQNTIQRTGDHEDKISSTPMASILGKKAAPLKSETSRRLTSTPITSRGNSRSSLAKTSNLPTTTNLRLSPKKHMQKSSVDQTPLKTSLTVSAQRAADGKSESSTISKLRLLHDGSEYPEMSLSARRARSHPRASFLEPSLRNKLRRDK
ncbi:uncharacterized protein LOC100908505 [Galendromus occidentalis]|uniref:Uncharacterized protein LOC100908505 n=1 Tax=Galendromus occidentalis TaxID=34638 RepID=A0AAJ7P9M9_9ACAR|nr:uncharacterized protein LOC100908505 [Galendromus occidentalis]